MNNPNTPKDKSDKHAAPAPITLPNGLTFTPLTEREREISAALAKHLARRATPVIPLTDKPNNK